MTNSHRIAAVGGGEYKQQVLYDRVVCTHNSYNCLGVEAEMEHM